MTETVLVSSLAVGTPNRFPALPMANVQTAVTNTGLLHNAGIVVWFGGPPRGKAAALRASSASQYWGLWISVISTVDEPGVFQRILVTTTAAGEGKTRLAAAADDDNWPPPWFGAIQSDRPDTAARTEEILRAEFGQNDHR